MYICSYMSIAYLNTFMSETKDITKQGVVLINIGHDQYVW